MDELGYLVRKKRKLENIKVKAENKDKLVRELNKLGKDFGFGKLGKDASMNDIRQAKKLYTERLGYDVLSLAVQEGNTVIADVESRNLRKSQDEDTKRLAEYSLKLAKAKKESNSHLSKSEYEFLERGNQNIKGYGNDDILSLFEKTKTKNQADKLISEVMNQDPHEIFYDKKLETFRRVFQKVEGVREEDLMKVYEKLDSLNFNQLHDKTEYLLQSLETYGSPKNKVGKYDGDETELANARLDDIMIGLGLKDTGKRKVANIFKKYKVETTLKK